MRLLASLVFLSSLLALSSGCREEKVHASAPRSWDMSTTEVEALDGLNGRVRNFDGQVAAVVSDANVREAIYAGVLQIQARSKALETDGAARCGVAVVATTTPHPRWVEAGR